jgi:hypothetical protein
MEIALTAGTNAASQMRRAAQDGYGSKADVEATFSDVCFAPISGHFNGVNAKSALCHVWTAPGWQELSSRRRLGRCCHVFGL